MICLCREMCGHASGLHYCYKRIMVFQIVVEAVYQLGPDL